MSYTGNGTAGATVGHGLGVTPKMIIVKKGQVFQLGMCIMKQSEIQKDYI